MTKKLAFDKVRGELAALGVWLIRTYRAGQTASYEVRFAPSGFTTSSLHDARNIGLAMARQLRVAPPPAPEGCAQLDKAVAQVHACINAQGVENTLISLCTILTREGKPFGQRLAHTLERFLRVAGETDKERYGA